MKVKTILTPVQILKVMIIFIILFISIFFFIFIWKKINFLSKFILKQVFRCLKNVSFLDLCRVLQYKQNKTCENVSFGIIGCQKNERYGFLLFFGAITQTGCSLFQLDEVRDVDVCIWHLRDTADGSIKNHSEKRGSENAQRSNFTKGHIGVFAP